MPGWIPIGIRWRHPATHEGDSLAIVPPLGVMLFIPAAAIWVPIVLLYSFGADLGARQQLALAGFGGVAPIVIAYGVMTNRVWTRIGALLAVLANIWVISVRPGTPILEQITSNEVLGIALAAWVGLALYLYTRKTARAYYLLVAGKPLPMELEGVDLSPPRVVVFAMDHLAILAEWILVILALAIFLGFLFFSNFLGIPVRG